jgi:hypothetical protein
MFRQFLSGHALEDRLLEHFEIDLILYNFTLIHTGEQGLGLLEKEITGSIGKLIHILHQLCSLGLLVPAEFVIWIEFDRVFIAADGVALHLPIDQFAQSGSMYIVLLDGDLVGHFVVIGSGMDEFCRRAEDEQNHVWSSFHCFLE